MGVSRLQVSQAAAKQRRTMSCVIDESLARTARTFHEALIEAGIPHLVLIFVAPGGLCHSDHQIAARFVTHAVFCLHNLQMECQSVTQLQTGWNSVCLSGRALCRQFVDYSPAAVWQEVWKHGQQI